MLAQSEELLLEARRIFDAFITISNVEEETLATTGQVNDLARNQFSHVKDIKKALYRIIQSVKKLEQDLEY